MHSSRIKLEGLQEDCMAEIDIEKISSKVDIDKTSVKTISEKCNQLKQIQEQIKQDEEKLSLLKHKARDFEERVIPEMMQEAGVSLLKLDDGSTIEVKHCNCFFQQRQVQPNLGTNKSL